MRPTSATATLGTIITKREQFHSNVIGQAVTTSREEVRQRLAHMSPEEMTRVQDRLRRDPEMAERIVEYIDDEARKAMEGKAIELAACRKEVEQWQAIDDLIAALSGQTGVLVEG